MPLVTTNTENKFNKRMLEAAAEVSPTIYCNLSKTSLTGCHNLSRQLYRQKVLCVQQDIWFGKSGSHCMLKR